MIGPRHRDEILRTVVGSGLHGLAIEGTDDHDEMGIYIEPPESVLGLGEPDDTDVWRTQPEGHRSGPGDVDLVRYGLRKYLRLAVQGNPTILLPLFAPEALLIECLEEGRQLRDLTEAIVSERAGPRFLGYMTAQVQRLKGERSRPTTRTELVDEFGYDTKFASHALRLAIQGVELLSEGRIHLPMKPDHLNRLRAIKTGLIPEAEVLKEVLHWGTILKELVENPPGVIRPYPDRERLVQWLITTHLSWWERERFQSSWQGPN